MLHPFNTKEIRIKLNDLQVQTLYNYVSKCIEIGFVSHNDFHHVAKEREFFYKWFLKDLLKQLFTKGFKIIATQQKNHVVILNEAHQRTLSIMFNRVECEPYMLTLQPLLLKNLLKP